MHKALHETFCGARAHDGLDQRTPPLATQCVGASRVGNVFCDVEQRTARQEQRVFDGEQRGRRLQCTQQRALLESTRRLQVRQHARDRLALRKRQRPAPPISSDSNRCRQRAA